MLAKVNSASKLIHFVLWHRCHRSFRLPLMSRACTFLLHERVYSCLLTRCWRKDWTSWELNGAVDMFEELSDKDLECALNSPRWQITRHSQSSLFAASQSVNAGLRWLSSQKKTLLLTTHTFFFILPHDKDCAACHVRIVIVGCVEKHN